MQTHKILPLFVLPLFGCFYIDVVRPDPEGGSETGSPYLFDFPPDDESETETMGTETEDVSEGVCGDGVVEGDEECDGLDLNDQTCEGLGFSGGGDLYCSGECTFKTNYCMEGPTLCGNQVIDENEECDLLNNNGESCWSQGFNYGQLECNEDCTYDYGDCWTCGDGVISGPENCDGDDLNGLTCEDFGLQNGTLNCNINNCLYNLQDCGGPVNDPVCGNDIVEIGEECDGLDFGGQDCTTWGFDGGTLACFEDCKVDVGECEFCTQLLQPCNVNNDYCCPGLVCSLSYCVPE